MPPTLFYVWFQTLPYWQALTYYIPSLACIWLSCPPWEHLKSIIKSEVTGMCLSALVAKYMPQDKDRQWDTLHISDELVGLKQFSRLPYSTYHRDN